MLVVAGFLQTLRYVWRYKRTLANDLAPTLSYEVLFLLPEDTVPEPPQPSRALCGGVHGRVFRRQRGDHVREFIRG